MSPVRCVPVVIALRGFKLCDLVTEPLHIGMRIEEFGVSGLTVSTRVRRTHRPFEFIYVDNNGIDKFIKGHRGQYGLGVLVYWIMHTLIVSTHNGLIIDRAESIPQLLNYIF